jgi:quinol monooxygenase YgiN
VVGAPFVATNEESRMSFLLQATCTLPDVEIMRQALDWLHEAVGETEGLVSLRVFTSREDPTRVTMLEEWDSEASFEASFEKYTRDQREEFLARLGLTVDSFERAFWLSTGIEIASSSRST